MATKKKLEAVPDNGTFAVRRLRDDEPFVLPKRQYPGDAALDISISRHVSVAPRQRVQLPSNMAVAIPMGHFGLVIPRSSTFHKRGLIVHNGVIDSGFRGEVMTLVYNPGDKSIWITEGERVSQLLILPATYMEPIIASKLVGGDREEKGFGSTGGFANEVI